MKTEHEKTISILNDLVETCNDGHHGFRTAGEDAEDQELRNLFEQFAAERQRFTGELQNRIRSLGGDPDQHGSVSGTLHRGWIDIKSAIASNEPHSVLAECERGEDAALKAYREALKKDLDLATRDIVSRQLTAIQAAHDRVKQLRDSSKYATR
ncbi:PA2169 family four-helix-bundle protein [Horticoccus luteus]|uniref:PA2169 family four-helix-bundle protein n=1 Tax=Horticoccus luteus TaxID=2862869 RepID=A0A8F9TUW4_9BACT|nr:PA2169 family four-helix-bundle protein [Horticoccus luteus]QYM78017.1 PA2169 family four-helix-bundle protein [Horticoccus luteus]